MSYFPMFGRKLKMSWKIISQFSLFNFALDSLAWIELFSRKMLAKTTISHAKLNLES